DPKLLIFDEPFSGFDPINASLIKDEILRLRDNGATIIFSTHNMASVEELCDHIALINKSKKILEGRVSEIKSSYKSDIYKVEITGFNKQLKDTLNHDFEVVEETYKNEVLEAQIKILNKKSTNELIMALMPYGNIHAMQEIVPTMNDIFIAKVNSDTLHYNTNSSLTE
ncbi:MAG TPA: DUF4162 domain-containing protein, partial [Bacteroidales bacterium]|nr:DUF4162 domain-containing protein [Bacteroidales bacterium]